MSRPHRAQATRARASSLPRHRSSEGQPVERGYGFGLAHAERVGHTIDTYLRMFAEDRGLGVREVAVHGAATAARVRSFRPELADEIEGIAAGARRPVELLFACNARTEMLAGGRLTTTPAALECSAVGVGGADRVVLGQTWDFHPDLVASRVLWTIHDERGWRCVFTEAGIVGKFGLSSRGIATTLNFLTSDADGGEIGVPVHVLARAVLDECSSIEQARALLEATEVSSSVCVTVAGPHGGRLDVVAFERWPGGIAALDRDGRDWLVHTNHFLADVPVGDLTRSGTGWRSSRDRMRRLRELAPQADSDPLAIGRILTDRDGDDPLAPVFREDDGGVPWLFRRVTLATLAFELPACRVWVLPAQDPERALEPIDP